MEILLQCGNLDQLMIIEMTRNYKLITEITQLSKLMVDLLSDLILCLRVILHQFGNSDLSMTTEMIKNCKLIMEITQLNKQIADHHSDLTL